MDTALYRHYRQIKLILVAILALNWSVALLKILFGMYSRCYSITADGFHSLSDGTSNIIGLVGISLASQPKDKDHPYGHKKYETFFSLGIALLLFLVSLNLIKQGIVRLYRPVAPQVNTASFLVMLVSLGINLWVMRYEHKKGQELKSDILVCDALHTRADILTSLSVIIALLVINSGYPIIDPIATILISLFIARSGIRIIGESSKVLCDTAAIIDVNKISEVVLKVKGVKTCHKIRTRGRPDDIHVDLHVQVKPDMHIDEAHKISYVIEETIRKSMPQITDVVVHMEPKEAKFKGPSE